MSLWYPTRQFPPLPHAETHLKGGSDEVLNLTNINNAIGFPIESHADRHGYGGADPVSLDASQIVSGTLSLDRIPDSLTGKDADLWDGKHRSDDQTIGGNVTIGGDLRVNGDDIKDSGGNVRITLGDPVIIEGKIRINGNQIIDGGGNLRIELGTTTTIYAHLDVTGSLDVSQNITIASGKKLLVLGGNNYTAVHLECGDPPAISAYWSPYIRLVGKSNDGTGVYETHTLIKGADGRVSFFLGDEGSEVEKMYLTRAGDLYIDGTYNTFSPKVGDTVDELVKTIEGEVYKGEVMRNERGEILCPVCKKKMTECFDRKHREELHRKYAKDISKIAIATGKLILKLLERINSLEVRLNELESTIAGGSAS